MTLGSHADQIHENRALPPITATPKTQKGPILKSVQRVTVQTRLALSARRWRAGFLSKTGDTTAVVNQSQPSLSSTWCVLRRGGPATPPHHTIGNPQRHPSRLTIPTPQDTHIATPLRPIGESSSDWLLSGFPVKTGGAAAVYRHSAPYRLYLYWRAPPRHRTIQ